MSKIIDYINCEEWDEAYDLLGKIIDNGNLDEETYVAGAAVLEHFGYVDAMYEIISSGLKQYPRNYELYLMLGNYYASSNPNQAYLSYENALYFAEKAGDNAKEDVLVIEEILEEYVKENQISLRNVSFIILSFNTIDYTKLCVQSIRNNCKTDSYEIVVVDNASTDGSVEWLQNQNDIILVKNKENVGFPAGCNQGIRMASQDNDIFLLNNDAVLMINSLYQLRMGLYESERHGAVGAVTNYAANGQIAYSEGKKLEDYYEYAYATNVPAKAPYEQKSMLIMFAMLIKREAFDIVGELDERFSPGNFEDNDYGVRILKAGFQNVLCWNSFIFHYGSRSFGTDVKLYKEIYLRNRARFLGKWGFLPEYYMYSRKEIADLIDKDSQTNINILEIGCGLGDTLAAIKYRFPYCDVHGIEIDKKIAMLGSSKFDIKCGNVETYEFESGEKYDFIIFADVLEHLYDPYSVIHKMKEHLNVGGCILASIPNILNAHVIYDLLNGNFTYQDAGILDRTHIRFFTQNEIYRMFEQDGYEIDQILWKVDKHESTQINQGFFDKLIELVGEDKKILFDTYQYLIRARIK